MLSKKRRLIIAGISAAAVFVILTVTLLVALFSAVPVITLSEKEQTVEVFSEYTAPDCEANARVLWINKALDVDVASKVDTSVIGDYKVKYTSSFMGRSADRDLTVHVVDTTAPAIESGIYDVQLEYAGRDVTPDDIDVTFTALDNYDGDITDRVVKTVEGNICYLTVTDSSGNTAVREINIIVNDGVHPTILLTGASTVYVKAGGNYAEPGFSAKDNKDGDITYKVYTETDLDTTRSGTYIKTYSVSDDSGNTSKITRKIVVYGSATDETYENVSPNGKTVYLTFDDGPGRYTKTLLEYLERYDVKATFFVTNQFSSYQSVLGDIYSAGHKLAIHTYSHQIYSKTNNIYSSVDAYMEDFNKMQSLIEKYTGSTTNIFRFPGGTNNTISRNYCKGIMTELSRLMTSQGYYYFDWNVDSYDSRSSTTTQDIITETINQISKKNNAVVLMHDIHQKSVEAVPAIIEYCLSNGYTFCVLDETAPAVRYSPQN